jgi:hypothetical protein
MTPEFNDLLRYDAETGELFWKSNNRLAGHKHKSGYVNVKVKGKMYRAHRVIWAMVYGKFPDLLIDHINGVPSDNRMQNLREVSCMVNQQNQRQARKDNAGGNLGAHLYRGKWMSQIRVDGKLKYLGNFSTKEEAHDVYIQAKRQMHEGSTL